MIHRCYFLAVSVLILTLSHTAIASDRIAKNTPAPELSTASPATHLDAGYLLHAGDLLQITVWKEDGLDREVLILPDGSFDFPLIGSLNAAGLTPAQLQALLKTKLTPFIPAAAVTVLVKETRGNAVSVIGQVTRPGDIVMNRALTVMQALSQAGGLTPYADGDDISILRTVNGMQTAIAFDYSDISKGRHLESNITLQPGDVIVVPSASLF